jgi:hypothetical protein
MGFLKDLIGNRRGLAVIALALNMGLKAVGITATDTQVGTFLDTGAQLFAAGMALWSLRAPRQAAP